MGLFDFQSARHGAGVEAFRDTSELPAEARAWSDPEGWGGHVPAPDADVVVPAGRTVVVDRDLSLKSLTVFGTLLFAPRDVQLTAGWILVVGPGVLRAGTVERPRTQRLVITLDGADRNVHGLGSRFLAAVRGGTIDLHGRPCESWVLLGDTPVVGTRRIRTVAPVAWQPGDRIAIASGGAELPLVEERTIVAVEPDRCTLELDAPLAHRHPGQYGPVRRPLPSDVAKVVLLGRSIVVEGGGAHGAGIGGQCVIRSGTPEAMDGFDAGARSSIGRFTHVEFRRLGQLNRADRFPVYWFGNGDSSASCLVDCLVHRCHQRGVVIRASPHVRISGNVVYQPYGHGYVIDQAHDSAQIVAGNLAVRPHVVRFTDPELRGMHEHRPRAFWFGAPRPSTLGRPLR